MNNGVLKATKVSNRNSKIVLSADDVQLNNKSDIKGESEVAFTSNNDKNIKITSQNGSKIPPRLKSTLKRQKR